MNKTIIFQYASQCSVGLEKQTVDIFVCLPEWLDLSKWSGSLTRLLADLKSTS